jgi:hypothetical protein
MGSSLMMSREKECIMNRAVEGVLGWWPAGGALRLHELLVICLRRKEGRMDGQRIGNVWVERGDSACLVALSYACEEKRTDIDAHYVKSECNMKIVPFKGVLWLLGGARRQLHGKGRLRVLWLLVGAGRQVRLSCTPRKDGHRRLRQKH